MTALWMNLWKSSHAPLTHLLAAFALTAVTHHSRNPENTGHGTSHASHAPWAVTLAPLFSKGARVPHRRPSQPLTTPQPVRYSTPMATWSPEQRAHALKLLQAPDANLDDVTNTTGIPKSTLSRWAKAEGIDLLARSQAKTAAASNAARAKWAERRADLADRIGQVTDLALEQATGFLAAGRPREAKDAALTLAILVDKAQLLTGAATARTEHLAPDRTPEQEQELAQVLALVRTDEAAA